MAGARIRGKKFGTTGAGPSLSGGVMEEAGMEVIGRSTRRTGSGPACAIRSGVPGILAVAAIAAGGCAREICTLQPPSDQPVVAVKHAEPLAPGTGAAK